MSEGFYLMHRGWQDHPVFGGEPFSRRDAFEWLIAHASHRPRAIGLPGRRVTIQRGQLCYSLRYMAKAWRWTEPKVRRWLARLQNEEMIALKTDAGQTVVTIVNYDTYQPSVTATDAAPTQHRRSTDANSSNEKKEKNISIHPSKRASAEEEDRISFVIRLTNRGMAENPAIDQHRFRPILPQHGDSREVVAEWRAAGVDWSTMEAVVYDRAQKYKPSDRYPQINSLSYLRNAVMDAHERQRSMQIEPPSIAETSDGEWLNLVPAALREWADRLTAKLEADEIARPEAERVRDHLARANEAETRRMRPAERDAFIGLRLLNWYGERVGDPKPKLAA